MADQPGRQSYGYGKDQGPGTRLMGKRAINVL